MIAYNATLLDSVYHRLLAKFGEKKAKAIMSSRSPVAWPHILLSGRYHFKRESEVIDLDKVISELEANLRKALP